MLRPKGGSEVCSVLKESFQESCKRNRGNLGNGICSMCGMERKMDEEDFRDILLYEWNSLWKHFEKLKILNCF